MLSFSRRAAIMLVLSALALPWLPSASRAETPLPQGPVLLTLTGKIDAPNRGAMGADDKFFGYADAAFENATQFDYAMLSDLPNVTVRADFPKGGPEHQFTGPLLADVLKAAGARGEMVTIHALDGYSVQAPLGDLVAQGAVVALARNGTPFAIGDYGPTQIVFPWAERADLADLSDDNWVWSIYHIHVQ